MKTEDFSELINASREGDIDGLYTIIHKQPDILRRIDEKMFEHTPMHEAASTGKIRFTNEMMNLMPSFARKLNKEGLSPMHLAVQNGHVELVFCLLNVEPDLARVKGKNGMTTLHCAAEKGYHNMVANLLAVCPSCVQDVNVDGETVLHVAVREKRLEVSEVVVRWLRRLCHGDAYSWIANIGKQRNVQGHTALDVAVSSDQIKAIMLLGEIHAKSSDGLRAKAFLHGRTQLHRSRSTDPQPFSSKLSKQPLAKYLKSELWFGERLAVTILRLRMRVSDTLRDALLVVGGLMLTASFQVVYNRPVGIAANGTSIKYATAHGIWSLPEAIVEFDKKLAFNTFVINNSVILFAAICMISFLLAEASCGPLLSVFLVYLLRIYGISILYMAPNTTVAATYDISTFILSVLLLLIVTIFFLGRLEVLKANQCRKNIPLEEVKAVDEEVLGSNGVSIESA